MSYFNNSYNNFSGYNSLNDSYKLSNGYFSNQLGYNTGYHLNRYNDICNDHYHSTGFSLNRFGSIVNEYGHNTGYSIGSDGYIKNAYGYNSGLNLNRY